MILVLGLVILIAAIVVGLAGIFGNTGAGHELGTGGDFSVLGYHATGSTGSLFLSGVVVGAVALLGLTLVVIGARRSARRSARARRDLDAARRESVVTDRGGEGDLARGDTRTDGTRAEAGPQAADAPRSRGHWFGHRAAPR
ncbi:hypothetical protein [Streptomyces erythrochromogenes]|uniref:hypothetical protein n=1 Tax=Streptomyces erythrochromogenes TaxID=285574 RepID=UPI00381D32BE|nr:hypothetical protein OG489_02225 [Streptomyces erythrochromogenes]